MEDVEEGEQATCLDDDPVIAILLEIDGGE